MSTATQDVINLRDQVKGLECKLAKAEKASLVDSTGSVVFTGENSFVALRSDDSAEDNTLCAHWRAVYSPEGAGTVLFIQSKECTDGQVKIYSDNPKLVRFIQKEFEILMRPQFAKQEDLVIPAMFERAGSTSSGGEYSEIIRHEDEEICLSWSDMVMKPFLIRFEVGGVFADHGVYSNIMPAGKAVVKRQIKGAEAIIASGECYDSDMAGHPSRSSCLALGETWLKRDSATADNDHATQP